MTFLADENIPLDVVKNLQKENIDIVSLSALQPGITDQEALTFANKKKMVFITFDKDFGEMVFKKKMKSHGIILLRIHPQNVAYISSILKKVIAKEIEFGKSFCVVEEHRVRVIPLHD